jgi:hypothetical protein
MATTKRAKPAAKAAAKPKRQPPPGTAGAFFYLPEALLEALDRWTERVNESRTGPQWSRTDVVRAALQRAVDERAAKGEAP